MRIDGAFHAGLRAMEAATARLERSAVQTARPGGAGDLGAVVDRIVAKHDFTAGVSVVRTADEMVGTLIDIVA